MPDAGRPKKIGVFGGTFDPPHVAHLIAATQAWATLGLDEVLFVVAGGPWQKEGEVSASADDRVKMTELAISSYPGFAVSRIEADKHGPSYTIDTVKDLRRQNPEAEIWIVAGSDALAGIQSWRNWKDLIPLAKFAIVPRPGTSYSDAVYALGNDAQVEVLEKAQALEVSSTQIRERIAEGRPIAHLVQGPVEEYIKEHRLYGM